MQIKTPMQHHFISTRMVRIKKITASVDEAMATGTLIK